MNASDPTSQPVTADDRTWGMIAHLSALAFLVLPPVGGALGPLVVWLLKREQSAFASDAAKEALNFNITVLIGYAICALLVFVFIGFLLGGALFLAWLVLTIVAGIRAGEGGHYRYPVALRLVK